MKSILNSCYMTIYIYKITFLQMCLFGILILFFIHFNFFVSLYFTGITSEYDVSSCPLSCSDTDSYTKSTEENSFSSPELFRGSDYLSKNMISSLNGCTVKLLLCPYILQWIYLHLMEVKVYLFSKYPYPHCTPLLAFFYFM